jgi:hypothetical protein
MTSKILRMLTVLAFIALPLSALAIKEPIYINLATNDSGKVLMALDASRQYAEKGYPIVIYLNDKAVMLGVEASSGGASKEQVAIKRAIANGATVIICPTCLEDQGFTRINLMQGVVLGAEHQNNR